MSFAQRASSTEWRISSGSLPYLRLPQRTGFDDCPGTGRALDGSSQRLVGRAAKRKKSGVADQDGRACACKSGRRCSMMIGKRRSVDGIRASDPCRHRAQRRCLRPDTPDFFVPSDLPYATLRLGLQQWLPLWGRNFRRKANGSP